MSILRRFISGAALFTVATVAASAASISFSNTTPSTSTPFTSNFTLPEFNTSLGTLTGITISTAYSLVAEVDVFNSLGTTQAYTNATANIPLTLNSSIDSLTTTATATAGPASGTCATLAFCANGGLTTTGTLSLIVPLADLSEYEGGGSDSFSVVSAGGTYGGSASPGVFFSGNATASGVTTITYTYSVVSATPEPTTMVLFGSALVGLGLLRKRIRS